MVVIPLNRRYPKVKEDGKHPIWVGAKGPEIPQAEATDHFELRTESMAVRIKHDSRQRVTGVDYLDADGQLKEQKVRAVCVGGNVVETTRLLLNSQSDAFPQGLANSSGMLGRLVGDGDRFGDDADQRNDLYYLTS